MDYLKKRLEVAKGIWAEELPGALWAYRTTERQPTGETPFPLAYGMKAIIPTEIQESTLRPKVADALDNEQQLVLCLDLLE